MSEKDMTPEERADDACPHHWDSQRDKALRDAGFTAVSADYRERIADQIRAALLARAAAHAAEVGRLREEWQRDQQWMLRDIQKQRERAEAAEARLAAEVARLEKERDEARKECDRLRESTAEQIRAHGRHYVEQIDNLRARLATAPAGWSAAKVRADIAAAADRHYLRGLELARDPACRGWEAKVQAGAFGLAEMSAHAAMNLSIGRHQGMHEALRALDAEPQPAQQGGREEAAHSLASLIHATAHGQCTPGLLADALDRYLAAKGA